jgi:predicted O-methyltransferase YrrM
VEQELFDVLTELEMRDQKERMQGLPQSERIRAMDPDAAKFVFILTLSNKAKSIVEVGSGVGYATLWLAYAASLTGGKVIACEIDPAKADKMQANLAKAGMADWVEVLVGDARELLRQRGEPVDFLLIDGAKAQYETYFDVVYKQMGVGAMIVADNVVSHEDELSDYVTYVQNHPNLESVTVPLARGLEISVKISE